MKKQIIQTIISTFFAMGLYAQTEDDALRFSQFDIVGTGRFNALSGAFSALGGDFTSIHINPASTGVFRKTEISYTPFLNFNANNTLHYNSEANDIDTRLRTGNFGFVISSPFHNGTRWQSKNLAVSFNKLANFDNNITIQGVNNESSLLDVFKYDIERGIYNPFGSNLAWQTYLVDTLGGEYFTQIPQYGQNQLNTIFTRGNIREMNISYGVNYDDQLYIGGSVGFLSMRYTRNSFFSETLPLGDTTSILNSFQMTENLTTNGSGIRAGIGVIYRPIDFIRLSASAHTSSIMSLQDNWDANIEADYKNFGQYNSDLSIGTFEYTLRSPARYNAGLAFILGKYGLISMDYEMVDYSNMFLKSRPISSYSFADENSRISSAFNSVHTIRSGAEIRLNSFTIRAGASYRTNVYTGLATNDNSMISYSFGGGYRAEHFYCDLGFITRSQSSKYYIYDPAFVKSTNINTSQLISSITFGVRF